MPAPTPQYVESVEGRTLLNAAALTPERWRQFKKVCWLCHVDYERVWLSGWLRRNRFYGLKYWGQDAAIAEMRERLPWLPKPESKQKAEGVPLPPTSQESK